MRKILFGTIVFFSLAFLAACGGGGSGSSGAAGAAGADAPCAACADVTVVVFDALCKLTSPTSLQEALDCGGVLASLALLGVNPCEGTTSDCHDEVMAGLTTLVQEKLSE